MDAGRCRNIPSGKDPPAGRRLVVRGTRERCLIDALGWRSAPRSTHACNRSGDTQRGTSPARIRAWATTSPPSNDDVAPPRTAGGSRAKHGQSGATHGSAASRMADEVTGAYRPQETTVARATSRASVRHTNGLTGQAAGCVCGPPRPSTGSRPQRVLIGRIGECAASTTRFADSSKPRSNCSMGCGASAQR